MTQTNPNYCSWRPRGMTEDAKFGFVIKVKLVKM